MWIKWMPLRYTIAYIIFICAPPIIFVLGVGFSILTALCYAAVISVEITRRNCKGCFIVVFPFIIFFSYVAIALGLFLAPLFFFLYYLMLIIVTSLIIFE